MQLLTFTVGGQAYAVESKKVVEVLPLVSTRPIPHLPDYLPGIFTYRGRFVPLVDLGLRINGMALTRRLSTRVIVVEIEVGESTASAPLSRLVRFGIMAENVVTIRSTGTSASEMETKDLAADTYLGRLLRLEGQTVQMLLPEYVIPHELLASLFPDRPHDADPSDRLTSARS
ncbi:MAG: chemotaxis protein CheW [Pirellulales bacterium]|jgi:chemotaxis-related protein WspB